MAEGSDSRGQGRGGSPEDGSVGTVSVEKTHHMLGIGLLLDIFVWPITGTNYGAVRPLYAVQDELAWPT
ncbi:MAG: hypothetical protein CM1200mP2_27070 [Planctomycetaceae bacterium]|nr:MAG: hypothetical protein CM1200mP2_27070 [Planctomycetaceae bacterium]